MIEYIVFTIIVVVFLTAILAFIVYNFKKQQRKSEEQQRSVNIGDSIKKAIKPVVETWGERVNKRLLVGFRSEKGTVVKQRKYDVPTKSVAVTKKKNKDGEPADITDQDVKKVEDSLMKELENSDIPEDLKENALERVKSGKVPNRALLVKDGRFRGKKQLMFISETDVLHEDKNQLILRSNIEPRPLINTTKPEIWYTDSISTYSSLTSTVYQDVAEELLGETKRNLESVRKFDVKHSQKLDELETKTELLEEMDKKGSATNYNYD